MEQVTLDDGTADRFLLDAKGVSLLAFHSPSCGTCRLARELLPGMSLPPVPHTIWEAWSMWVIRLFRAM